jgi:HdeA/HdeB family
MRRSLLVVVAVLLLSLRSDGQQQTTFEKYGSANTTCGTWLTTSGPSHDAMLEWTLGYLTAAGYYTAAIWNGLLAANTPLATELSDYCKRQPDARLCTNQLIKKTDPDAISSWLNGYCGDHRSQDLETASRALVESLGDK